MTGQDAGRLVVVLSTEGAGSSLVAAVLGGSPGVLAPPELHLFRYADFDRWVEAMPDAMVSLTWLLAALDQPAEPADAIRRFAGRSTTDVYRELLGLCGASRVLVDKTPAYARDTSVLRRIEELHPRYVWLVRHPLGVLASELRRVRRDDERRRAQRGTALGRLRVRLRRFWKNLRRLPGGAAAHNLAYWRDVNARLERWAAEIGPDRAVRIGYEQLVRAPESEVRRLCTALGLAFSPEMLEPGRHVPASLRWGVGSETVAQHGSIDPGLADRWRETLDERLLDEATREMVRRLELG